VAGGALAATQALGKDDEGTAAGDTFTGSLSGILTRVITSRNAPANTCTITRQVAGTVRLKLDGSSSASAVSGIIEINATDIVATQTCTGPTSQGSFVGTVQVSGPPSAIRGVDTRTDTRAQSGGEIINATNTVTFEGVLSGNTVTGTLKYEGRSVSTGGGGGPVDEASSGQFPVTLTKP
jgi:hypothetical protein